MTGTAYPLLVFFAVFSGLMALTVATAWWASYRQSFFRVYWHASDFSKAVFAFSCVGLASALVTLALLY